MAAGTELGARTGYSPGPPRPARRRIVLRAALALAVMVAVLVAGAWLAEYSLYRQLGHVDADLSGLRDRPGPEAGDAVDVAVIGVADDRWVSQMLLHIDADRRGAGFVSVPDTRMRVLPRWHRSMPAQPSGRDVTRVAARIERATGHRLDHVAVLDWRAVARLTDRLGGLDLWIGPAGADSRFPEALHVTGAAVLDMVRRHPCSSGRADAGDDARRIHREQALLQAVLGQTLHQELVRSPVSLYRDLDVLTENLLVDSGWSQRELVALVVSLRRLRSHAITFETVPGLDGLAPSGSEC